MNKPESPQLEQAKRRIERQAEIFMKLALINVAMHVEDTDPAVLQKLMQKAADVRSVLVGSEDNGDDKNHKNQS